MVSTFSQVEQFEIHVVTPDGNPWVVDMDGMSDLDEVRDAHKELVAWLHGCVEPRGLPEGATAIRGELLCLGIEPLDCDVNLVRHAKAGKGAPNGWETVLSALAIPEGRRQRLDAAHERSGPRRMRSASELLDNDRR